MSRLPHPHAELIERLGGARQVAERLGIKSANTVHYWTIRGIPAARFPDIIRLAGKLKIDGVSFDRLHATRGDAPAQREHAAGAA